MKDAPVVMPVERRSIGGISDGAWRAALDVARRSPAMVLAVLVWWEVHAMRIDLAAMSQAVAVLVDRTPR